MSPQPSHGIYGKRIPIVEQFITIFEKIYHNCMAIIANYRYLPATNDNLCLVRCKFNKNEPAATEIAASQITRPP